MVNLVLTGIWFVMFVNLDYDNKYNILLEQRSPNSGNMVSIRVDKSEYKEGSYIEATIKAECNKVQEVVEGEGKVGSPWRAKDDWVWTRSPYICNGIVVGDKLK